MNELTYLLELGTEEIPARFMNQLLTELKEKTSTLFATTQITDIKITTFGTYRRLILILENLPEKQPDCTRDHKGPPARIAKDEQGNFLAPALAFAKRCHLEPNQLQNRTENNQAYLYATVTEKGQLISDFLINNIPQLIKNLSLPIAMKWGTNSAPFIRPVHWIVSLLNDTPIPVELYQIKSDRISYGHRMLTKNKDPKNIISGKPIIITHAKNYEKLLRSNKVTINHEKRIRSISTFIKKAKQSASQNHELIHETAFLTEYPKPLMAQFDPKYLALPPEVLVVCMQKHQKYFPIFHENILTSQFIFTAENVTAKSMNNIKSGNERVLKARLDDLQFFWDEDQKTTTEQRQEKLKHIVFQKGLGSIHEKTLRIHELSLWLAKKLNLSENSEAIQQTATFCKADLASKMVFELPELQGTMGKYFALNQQEPELVALGIEEHYLPKGQNDRLPKTITGLIVGLADRLDTCVCCFQNDLIPTGSQDPWGIRRAIYGIILLIQELKAPLSLDTAIDKAYEILKTPPKNRDKVIDFMHQRLRTTLIDHGYAYDLTDTVLALAFNNLAAAKETANALQIFRKKHPLPFKTCIETAVRIKRLTKATTTSEVEPTLFEDPIEADTWQKILQIQSKADPAPTILKKLETLSQLTAPMTVYFEKILVMHPDERIKANRLNFLRSCYNLYAQFGDLEKVVIEAQ